ncbi:metallophosphoesterase MPPED2-like isoform X3 [Crassostrea virginica]|uniref:Metallophosphoesterase MPPED2-like isoform X3 n=1 Tax=Crassostrea virginica TaxID=6565 RepID=A0A8B8D3A4_CRAVI|nr:metallophosphoesterase MPPED2-like isoform X3 [Crassostrea virginica]
MSCDEEITVDKDSGNPSKAWERIQVHQQHMVCPNPHPTAPITDDKIRFVCISDTHGKIEGSGNKLPSGDVLLHAGDFTQRGQMREIEKFNSYLGSLPYKIKVVIAGNHDISFDDSMNELRLNGFGLQKSAIESYLSARGLRSVPELLTNAIYLQDSSVTICGIKIYGSPWQPVFCDWGFNLSRGEDILEKWQKIPTNTQILITHGPPVGHLGTWARWLFKCEEAKNFWKSGRKYPMRQIF